MRTDHPVEVRLFEAGTVPECATPAWYADRPAAPHVEEPLHRPRLHLAAELVRQAVEELDAVNVVDVGAGDGGLLQLLDDLAVPRYGYDLSPANVTAAAGRGVEVALGDAVELVGRQSLAIGPAVVVATEVIEHLVDPHGFLADLAADANNVALVASSPWTETAGGAYEFHLWAWNELGYADLIEAAGWRLRRQQRAGMFTVVYAVNGAVVAAD